MEIKRNLYLQKLISFMWDGYEDTHSDSLGNKARHYLLCI